ncbi:MAG: hypothetical protein HUK20_15385 [Fibrobacter sp.]|nr:hypothetical protein [Fibrobacter sp.]
MDSRILFRFVGICDDLSALYDAFMDYFPEAELPSEDTGEWYSVDEVMTDEYECRFEVLPESALMAMDGSIVVPDGIPEEIFSELAERFEHVYASFKWSSFDIGVGCGVSDGWGEFNPDYMDDYSDEANEISEAVIGF